MHKTRKKAQTRKKNAKICKNMLTLKMKTNTIIMKGAVSYE